MPNRIGTSQQWHPAKEMGLEVLNGPLTEKQVGALGLSEARDILSKASKGEIPVNFKVYQTIQDVYGSDKTIPFDAFRK